MSIMMFIDLIDPEKIPKYIECTGQKLCHVSIFFSYLNDHCFNKAHIQ